LDLRHLRYFLAVADERHFGRAADRVGISQPPLSARIRELESELGVRLFHRGPGEPVSLTPAGATLLPEAREIITRAERARHRLQSIGRGDGGELRVGVTPLVPSSVLEAAVRAFRAVSPDLAVSLEELDSDPQLDALDHGRLDVAVVRHAAGLEREGAVSLMQTVLGVLIGRDDPLARSDRVRLSQLAGRALLLFPRHISPACHDELVQLCRRGGFEPASVHEATVPEDFAEALAATLVEGLATVSARPTTRSPSLSSLVWLPLEGSPLTITTSAVLPRVTGVPARRFVEALVDATHDSVPSRLDRTRS
jgi:DNA-binding transcriptional LysR family regulator